MTHDLTGYSGEELMVAGRHLEDLEVFAGQRSRMHPGPGWEALLMLLRADLQLVRAEQQQRAFTLYASPPG